jgi:hypothetical protein
MKSQINEIKRMQQLAGVINESPLNEELKADTLQSVAKEVASKNNMEFKMVDFKFYLKCDRYGDR